MIVFTRSYLIRTDSRLHRYFAVLEQAGLPWHAIAWDRTGQEPPEPQCTFYRRVSPVGGGWRNFGRILRWNLFLFFALWKLRREVRVVHAVDLDAALGAVVFCWLTGTRLLYDAFDQYSDTRHLTGRVKQRCDALERFCMKRAASVLLPDACRIEQHGLQGWRTVVVLENVPADTEPAAMARTMPFAPKRPWHLVYVGTLEPVHRGLEDLLALVAARADQVHLTMAGTGPLAELAAAMAARCSNIRFLGQVSPQKALTLLSTADIIVGMYYLTSRNHRYAAPNKYYEHLMLGKPLLTTVHTPPGQRVLAHATGWAIAEGQEALTAWLDALSTHEIQQRAARAGALWLEAYCAYSRQVLAPAYLACVCPEGCPEPGSRRTEDSSTP